MGSRGAFVNIEANDYTFVENGQKYHTIGFDGETKYLIQDSNTGSVKIPDYSHSSDRVYAILQDGDVKSIGIYEKHIKIKSIDLKHTHYDPVTGKNMGWRYHTDLYHKEPAHELSSEDLKLVNKILKGAKKYK